MKKHSVINNIYRSLELRNGYWHQTIIGYISDCYCAFWNKKLRNVGGDLGGAIKSFRAAVKDGEEDGKQAENEGETIDGEVTSKKSEKV